jgi:hypothetical protein
MKSKRPFRRRAWRMRLLGAALFASCAFAGVARASQVAIALELAQPHYAARESLNGFVLNHEQGGVGAAALSVEWGGGSGTWTLRQSMARGTVRYGGISQLGIPLSTTTQLEVDATEVRWSPPRSAHIARLTLQPRIGVSWRLIDRAVQASPRSTRLTEKLDATQLLVALMASYPLGMQWTLRAEAEAAKAVRQRLHVDTFGFYDKFTMSPHARYEVRFAAGIEWESGEHWGLAAGFERQQLRLGTDGPRDVSRDGEVVGSANYPGSEQHLSGARLRIRYRF